MTRRIRGALSRWIDRVLVALRVRQRVHLDGQHLVPGDEIVFVSRDGTRSDPYRVAHAGDSDISVTTPRTSRP